MKIYSLDEVIKMLRENRKLKFKIANVSGCNQTLTCIGEGGILKLECRGCKACDSCNMCDLTLEDKWQLVQEPVSFMEAVNSGKEIKPENFHGFYMTVYQLMEAFYKLDENRVLEYINGKWYIRGDME